MAIQQTNSSLLSSMPLASIAIALAALAMLALFLWRQQAAKAVPAAVAMPDIMADAEETSGVRVTLLFGTQTGTAERFAKQLKAELSERYGPDTQV